MADVKEVRDAAGKVIGTADRAQVVRDKFGEIIGEVGPPEPEPGPSAAERITQGFEQKATDAENEIAAIAEQMSACGNEAQLIRDRTKLKPLSFKAGREANSAIAALKAKCDEGRRQIRGLRKTAEGHDKPTSFLTDLDGFLQELDVRLGVPAVSGGSVEDRITRGLEKP